ncbi:Hemicentin-1 [Biomphalaria pfeifferi]|uniref:Hemicentin-1 n=1 Tax=Biomphalaria pfeifferi TaxID=112525 RepID=A0AAD8BW80_BIOPF|nr:Hemicentin-1 [Biomphalaria pfeifferi]
MELNSTSPLAFKPTSPLAFKPTSPLEFKPTVGQGLIEILSRKTRRMIVAWICLVSSQLASEAFSTKVNVTALGNEFLLAFPRLRDPAIYLLIYTLAKEAKVTLSLTNPGSSDHSRFMELSVKRSKSVQHRLSSKKLGMPSKKYSHHKCLLLTSDQSFGLYVHVYDEQYSLSSFMAVPIQAFGRAYIVITHYKRPFLTIMTQRKTKLFVSFFIYPWVDHVVDRVIQPISPFKWRTLPMESYQAFSLTKCTDKFFLTNISLTGSRIESGHPIGVISGSCSLIEEDCKEPEKAIPDMSSEMLLPVKMYGLRFVIVNSRQRTIRDFIWITASEPNACLNVYYYNFKQRIYLKDLVEAKHTNVIGYIVSDKPVAIHLLMNYTCQSSENIGGPSISMIVPNELFFNVYACLNHPASNIVSYISLVIPVRFSVENVRWNGGSIPYVNISKYDGVVKFGYIIVILELGSTRGEAFLEASFNFGCYFSGFSKGSFLQAAGFLYQDEKYDCSPSDQSEEDGLDNDCDGIVDEEYRNGLDDDGDGLIDEDTYNDSDCDKAGKWGKGCIIACADFCLDNCDTNTGACTSCLNGRTNLNNFCLDECPKFTYGLDCMGNCVEKCNGRDCVERSRGQCLSLDNMSSPVPVMTSKLYDTSELLNPFTLSNTSKLAETPHPLDITKENDTQDTKEHPESENTQEQDSNALWVVILAPLLIGVCGIIYMILRRIPKRLEEEGPVDDQVQDSPEKEKEPSSLTSDTRRGTLI